jgi:hypothetical protein
VQKIAKVICWLAVLILAGGVGLRWMLAPESAGAEFGIVLNGPLALNQVRGDMGGVFLGLGVITALGLVQNDPRLLHGSAIAIGGVILGRLIGIVLDGFVAMSAISIAIEAILLTSLLITASAMAEEPARAPEAES